MSADITSIIREFEKNFEVSMKVITREDVHFLLPDFNRVEPKAVPIFEAAIVSACNNSITWSMEIPDDVDPNELRRVLKALLYMGSFVAVEDDGHFLPVDIVESVTVRGNALSFRFSEKFVSRAHSLCVSRADGSFDYFELVCTFFGSIHDELMNWSKLD